MSRIALMNMALGFTLIFIAACGGVFVAVTSTEAFVSGSLAPQWQSMLEASSHGHTTLFGVIHILLGLTLPYARASSFENRLKTVGVAMGSLAMGPLLLVRAALGPTLSTELNGLLIGICLSCALVAIAYHAFGLAVKIASR